MPLRQCPPHKSCSYRTRRASTIDRVSYGLFFPIWAVHHGDGYYGLDPMEWKDQDVIFYLDHGSGSWAGIHYNEIPKLKNSIILNHACSTASLDDSISFSLNSIRQGAIAHVGAVKISSFNAPYPNIFSDIFKSDNELGKSVLYSYDKIMPEISLIGDPTFKLNPPHMLNE